jgi:hypothetical protein
MRLSDAGLRRRQMKAVYPDHRLPPWLTEDATRDRSNRLLEATTETQTGTATEEAYGLRRIPELSCEYCRA